MNQGSPRPIQRTSRTAASGPPGAVIVRRVHGRTPGGERADLYTLANGRGLSARISTFGGTVVSLNVPDRTGRSANVALGFSKLSDYVERSPYFGCLIGRCGNRIARARFSLDGKTHRLSVNNGRNSLHGGPGGFHAVVWEAEPRMTPAGPSLILRHTSPDGEEGFPGTLRVTATYTLTLQNELKLVYRAVTDRPTPVNLTQHTYFNLAGEGSGSVLNHRLTLKASRFTPVDRHLIPTGELRPVAGTPFDFRKPGRIGEGIHHGDPQLRLAGGYDHNWVADKPYGKRALLATVEDPVSGRVLKLITDQPGVQFYTGNFLDGSLKGRGGKPHGHRSGFCLEPQHFPDSPNRPEFPSVVLRPGEVYRNTIIYRFSTKP